MTSVKFNLLETPQNQKPSILDSNKSSKRRSIINLTESTDFHSTKISSKHLQIKRPSIFCSDSNINFNKITRNDVVILGGGGLFDNVNIWNVNINKLFDHCDNVIAWAVGFNTEKNLDAIKEKINFEKLNYCQ